MERGHAPGLSLPDFGTLDRIAVRAWLRAVDAILAENAILAGAGLEAG